MGLLNLIPVIGPIANAVSSYFNKKQDVDLEKYKVDGKIDETLIKAEIAIVQSRAGALQHLSWIHISFGAVAFIYWTAIVFDALTEKLFPSIHWDVMPLEGLAGITFNMVVGFFFLHSAVSATVGKITGR